MIFLHEVYIGKQKELLEMQQCIQNIKDKNYGMLDPKINIDPNIQKFNRLMESYFGFGSFALQIEPDPSPNAFTCPISISWDKLNKKNSVIVDKTGYKFKKDADYACILYITTGLLLNPSFSSDEIMAILLHEVGHNFYSIMTNNNAILSGFYTACTFADAMILAAQNPDNAAAYAGDVLDMTNFGKKLTIEYKNILQNNAFFKMLGGVAYSVKALAKTLLQYFVTINNIVGLLNPANIVNATFNTLVNKIKSSPVRNTIALPIMYRDERTADNFVTIYGYGAELSSALQKLESSELDEQDTIMNMFNKIPIVSQLFHLNMMPIYIVVGLFDPHPDHIYRAKDQIALLERELNKTNLDPKMRKCIQSDLNTCKKALDKYIDQSKGIKDPYICKKVYNSLLIKFDKGFKELLMDDKNKFDKYDKRYEDIFNSTKLV